jgi:hypothetical protein
MRDNGLTATEYTSLGGIDPLIAEPVLTALAEAGIAAYCASSGESAADPGQSTGVAEPTDRSGAASGSAHAAEPPAGDASGGSAGGPAEAAAKAEQPEADDEVAGDNTSAPAVADAGGGPETSGAAEPVAKADAAPAKAEPRPRIPSGFDEIFVDSGAVERARPVIARSTEDAEWKSLVEQFNAPAAPGHDGGATPVPRWPASEDVDDKYEPLIDVPAGLDAEDSRDDEEEVKPARKRDDPHDHFVPPEPPRGPKLDWISRIAWLGLIGGPLLLIAAAVLDFGTGRITTIAVVGFIAGFLTLVIRMNDRLPPGDSGDDGAVV